MTAAIVTHEQKSAPTRGGALVKFVPYLLATAAFFVDNYASTQGSRFAREFHLIPPC